MHRNHLALSTLIVGTLLRADTAGANSGPSRIIIPPPPPPPTQAQCLDPTFISQNPGEQSACDQLLSTELQTYAQSLTTSRQDLDQSTSPKSEVVPFDHAAMHSILSGFTSGYFGATMRHQAYVLNPSQNGFTSTRSSAMSAPIITHADPETAWHTDGTTASSCEEYGYKRYASYSQYQDSVVPFGEAWTAIVNRMEFWLISTVPSTVTDERGNPTMTVNWPARPATIYLTLPFSVVHATKQIMLDLPLLTYPYGAAVETMLSKGFADGSTTPQPVDEDAQYELVQQQIALFGEESLEEHYAAMKKFRDLLSRRAQTYADFELFWTSGNCDAYTSANPPALGPNQLTSSVMQRAQCNWRKITATSDIYNLDAQIDQAVANADPACFVPYGDVSPCTLSPHQIVDELDSVISTQREADYKQCMLITNNAFTGPNSVITIANEGGLIASTPPIPGGNWTANTASLKGLFELVELALQGIQLPIDPKTNLPMVGDGKGDNGQLGDSTFGAYYDYDVSWQITNLAPTTCQADLGVGTTIDVDGQVFGATIPVLSFTASVQSRAATNDVVAASSLEILGNSIYNTGVMVEPASFDLVLANVDKSQNVAGASQTFFVGPIPVTVSAGIAAGVGLESSLTGTVQRDCTPNSPTPFTATSGGSGAAVRACRRVRLGRTRLSEHPRGRHSRRAHPGAHRPAVHRRRRNRARSAGRSADRSTGPDAQRREQPRSQVVDVRRQAQHLPR